MGRKVTLCMYIIYNTWKKLPSTPSPRMLQLSLTKCRLTGPRPHTHRAEREAQPSIHTESLHENKKTETQPNRQTKPSATQQRSNSREDLSTSSQGPCQHLP
jgi:hypothetical protein